MNSKTRLFFYSAMVSVSMLATFACGDDGESPDDGTGGSGASDAGDGGAAPVTTGGKGGTTGGSKSGGDAGSGGETDEPGTGGAAPTGGNDSTGGRATGGKAGGGDAGSGQSTGGRMTTDGGAAGSGGESGAPADECDEGFYGPTCQPCDCETGNCNDGMDGDGACICPPGTTGADCDRCAFGFQDKDENGTCELACANNTCNGHGTCNDSAGEVQCTCAAAYTGARCTECAAGYQDADENGSCLRACAEDTCNDHGECSHATGTVVCSCEGGYTGTFCDDCPMGEQDNDDNGTCSPACEEDSCGENGDCDDDDGSLACDCYEGYDGAACDQCDEGFQDKDTNGSCLPACAEDSCPEHADCDDDDGSLGCTCQEGYEGESCDQCADGYEDDGMGVCEPVEEDPCVEAEFEGPPVGIPDDDEAGGAPVELVIATDFPVGEVELTVSVTHGHTGDLAVSLENTEHFVIVHAGNGCGEANWSSVTFDDDAQDPVACEAGVTSPPNYAPFQPLSAFDGDDSAGTWTVTVYDALPAETGTVDYAKIRICPLEP